MERAAILGTTTPTHKKAAPAEAPTFETNTAASVMCATGRAFPECDITQAGHATPASLFPGWLCGHLSVVAFQGEPSRATPRGLRGLRRRFGDAWCAEVKSILSSTTTANERDQVYQFEVRADQACHHDRARDKLCWEVCDAAAEATHRMQQDRKEDVDHLPEHP